MFFQVHGPAVTSGDPDTSDIDIGSGMFWIDSEGRFAVPEIISCMCFILGSWNLRNRTTGTQYFGHFSYFYLDWRGSHCCSLRAGSSTTTLPVKGSQRSLNPILLDWSWVVLRRLLRCKPLEKRPSLISRVGPVLE